MVVIILVVVHYHTIQWHTALEQVVGNELIYCIVFIGNVITLFLAFFGRKSFGTTLFVRPKEFTFLEPAITYGISESEDKFALTFCAENYAKSVCLSLKTADCVFSDNWFDIHGKEPVTIMIDKASLSRKMTAQELSEELEIMHN